MKFETKTYRFDEITTIFDKKRIPLSSAQRAKRQGTYRYYGAQGVIDYVDDYIFDGKYLLIAEDGENLKSKKQDIAQIVEGQFWVNNHAHIVQGNELCLTEYLCHLLNSMDLSGYITGSAQPKLSQANMNAITVELPPVIIQEKIISVLGALNRKITLNQQINDNLEQQARTLVQQWIFDKEDYIEFIPLSEVAIINPESYSPKEKWEYVNYLDTSSITGGVISEIQFINPESEKLPSRAKRKIKDNDIVFSTVRPNQFHYGLIKNPVPNMLASTGFAVIRSQNELITNELIYLCLTDDMFVEKMQQLAEQSTSTFPSIKPNDLSCCEIPVAQETVVKPITDTLCAIFEMIANNQLENARLANLRDSLLPKLMSGEIDVSGL